MRGAVVSSTRVSRRESTSIGAKTTTSASVVAVVTIVRAESDVGLPNGPCVVDERDASGDVNGVLPDAGVLLAVAAQPQRHRSADVLRS